MPGRCCYRLETVIALGCSNSSDSWLGEHHYGIERLSGLDKVAKAPTILLRSAQCSRPEDHFLLDSTAVPLRVALSCTAQSSL